MKLSRFTDAGFSEFEDFLRRLHEAKEAGRPCDVPRGLLDEDGMSEEVHDAETIEAREFPTRFELGGWLLDRVPKDYSRDRNLWAWLTLFLFDQLCPEKDGLRDPMAEHRLLPGSEKWGRYYRHLLAGPYLACRAHEDDPDRVRFILSNTPDVSGELFEQLASRQEVLTSRNALELASRLYWDSHKKKPKRGAGGQGLGSPREFGKYMMQLILTQDLVTLDAVEFWDMLPGQFAEFKE